MRREPYAVQHGKSRTCPDIEAGGKVRRSIASRAGFTLLEVVVAMLLIGIMSVMCMPAFLTGRMADGRANRSVAAADAVRRLAEELKLYVTADPALANGPGTGVDGWFLPGDTSGLRALESGVHNLDLAHQASWAAPIAPLGGALSYTVAVRSTPAGPQPTVTFLVSWQEP